MTDRRFVLHMYRHTYAAVLSASLLVFSGSSFAQDRAHKEMNHSRGDMQSPGGAMKHSGDPGSPAAGGEQGSQELMKSMQESQSKMQSMQMKGKTDHDFAEMMRMHHQAGIKMAEIQMKHGKDPAMKKMAKKIMTSQKKEVKEFDAWLQKNQ